MENGIFTFVCIVFLAAIFITNIIRLRVMSNIELYIYLLKRTVTRKVMADELRLNLRELNRETSKLKAKANEEEQKECKCAKC